MCSEPMIRIEASNTEPSLLYEHARAEGCIAGIVLGYVKAIDEVLEIVEDEEAWDDWIEVKVRIQALRNK